MLTRNSNEHLRSRSFLEWAFVSLAVLFQLASAQTTLAGTQEFLTRSIILAITLTLVIQAGLIVGGERVVEILSGRQTRVTSIVPALLIVLLTLSTSIIFSGFGFYKHYAYAEGNRTSEFTSTATSIRQSASELEQYRAGALSFGASKSRRLEEEEHKQEARANSDRLPVRARGIAREKRDCLHREISGLAGSQKALAAVNVIESATKSTPEDMRQSLIDSRNKITEAISNGAPDYLTNNPIPGEIPTVAPPIDIQSGFERDLQLRRPPAVFSLGIASVIDLASLLCLLCNIYVSPTEERILTAKRRIKRTWRAALPLGDTHDTFSVVRIRLHGLDVDDFQVVFEKPDWALFGSDLEVNRTAINHTLNQQYGERPIVVRYFSNASGERIVEDHLLSEQLEGDEIIYAHWRPLEDNGWPEVISDEGSN